MRRTGVVASGVAALAALWVGAPMLLRAPTLPVGALLLVLGAMPAAFVFSAAPWRRRPVGVLLVVAGASFGVTGLVLASRGDFLELQLALIDWRVLVVSAYSLAPVGWVTAGMAFVLAGVGMLLRRRGLTVVSVGLAILTTGYFAGSMVAQSNLLRFTGATWLDRRELAIAVILLFIAALLLVVAAVSPRLLGRPLPGEQSGGPPPGGPARADGADVVRPAHRRWARLATGAVVLLGGAVAVTLWTWLMWGPRFALDEVFPDRSLAECVADAMEQSGPAATVSHVGLTHLRSLSCDGDQDGSQIRSLDGIAELRGLARLDVASNHVSDLRPLAGLPELASIKLTHNDIRDLTALTGLPVLSDLGVSDNAVADLGPLARVTTLRTLGLARNQLSDLTPLADLANISSLDVSENHVASVAPLARLPQLQRLTLAGNDIRNPTPLRNLPALTMLDIARNRIADTAGFAGFASLSELWLGGNPVTDVTPLAALPALTGVDLRGTDAAAITGVDVLRARNIYVGGLAK